MRDRGVPSHVLYSALPGFNGSFVPSLVGALVARPFYPCSVRAKTHVVVFVLSRDEFDELLGPLETIIQREAEERKADSEARLQEDRGASQVVSMCVCSRNCSPGKRGFPFSSTLF